MAKVDINALVTDSIITAIEAGTPPWRKPWTGDAAGGSFPLRSNGEGYRGINVLLLWCAAEAKGYSSAHWFTYNQAKTLSAQVKKDEKSTRIVKYGTCLRENKKDGSKENFQYLKQYNVFNADQIAGLPEEFYTKPIPPIDLGTVANPELEDFFASLGVPIDTSKKASAFYNLKTDRIHMPLIQTFHSAADYYGTLAHEEAHATGHKNRLDRFQKFQGSESYAFEELVAEIAACILGSQMDFRPNFEQSAAYIETWLKQLNNDKKMIFKAASAAQKAVDFIKDKAAQKMEVAA